MPYLVVDRDNLDRVPRLQQAEPFACSQCGSTTFTRDMFNPYITAPDRAGYYHEWIVVQCGDCGHLHAWHFNAHIDDRAHQGTQSLTDTNVVSPPRE